MNLCELRKGLRLISTFLLVVSFIFGYFGGAARVSASENVVPDNNLREFLNNNYFYRFPQGANSPSPDITATDMEKLADKLGSGKSLILSNKGIKSLEGLQYAQGIKHIDLSNYTNAVDQLRGPANEIGDEGLKILNQVQSLEIIDVGNYYYQPTEELPGNHVTQLGALANHPNLYRINVEYNKVTSVAGCETIPKLSELVLGGNSELVDISPLAKATNLQTLFIFKTAVTTIEPLSTLNELVYLDMSHTQVSDLSPLMGLEKLHSLFADHCAIGNVEALKDKKLKILDLDNNYIVDISPLNGMPALARDKAIERSEYPFSVKEQSKLIEVCFSADLENPVIDHEGQPVKPLSIENGTLSEDYRTITIEDKAKEVSLTFEATHFNAEVKESARFTGRVIFVPAESFTIVVENGTADYEKACPGTPITITANQIDGKEFKSWEIVAGSFVLANSSSAVTSFVMPRENVMLKAVFEDVVIPSTPIPSTSEETTVVSPTELLFAPGRPAKQETSNIVSSEKVESQERSLPVAKAIQAEKNAIPATGESGLPTVMGFSLMALAAALILLRTRRKF